MKLDKKIEWEYQVDRAYMPLSYSFNAFINSRKHIRKYLDICEDGFTGQFFYPNDVFWNKGIRAEVSSKQTEHHKKEGNEYLWKMAKVCEDRGEKLLKDLNARLSTAPISTMQAEELEQLFTWAVNEIKDFSVFITIPWVMEAYLNELISEIVKKTVSENEIESTVASLLTPIKINESSKETPAIWKLAAELNKSKSGINDEVLEKIDSFIEDYGWVHIRWFKGTPLTRNSVISRLEATAKENPEEKLEEMKGNEKRIRAFVEEFAKKHSLSETQKDTIYLVKEYVYIRTYRTDTLGQAFFSLFPVLERAAELLGLSLDDTLYHSEAELRKKLRGEATEVDVNARKDVWAILIIDDEYKIYSGKVEVEKLKKEQGVSRNVENISEVKGQSAFKGKVTGKVKIVLDPNGISKVEKGDILVAVMTFPSYIAAMEKAAAFVTDEGGILCHASIIAREMKKPCIISTKMGTKVFKDGDMVEVDADKGIVRILS